MAGPRRSTRHATASSSQGSGTATNGNAGTKRKAEASSGPKAKRGRKPATKQTTIEESMPDKQEESTLKDVEMEEAKGNEPKKEDETVEEKAEVPASHDTKEAEKDEAKVDETEANGSSSKMDDTAKVEPQETTKTGDPKPTGTNGSAVQKSPEREASTPSSILEKGLIYFFFRGRVGIDDPSNIDDLARSYIVLRPLPQGAKLGDGPVADKGNNRLLALPKKVLPISHRDRFMVFVEEAHSSIEDIKAKHLTSSDYMTKTAGARHTPAATPVAEGVYAITTTGRESHLAYIITIPSELSEVQRDVGLRERGSFVTSLKNPQYPGPANTNLPQGPEFPEEILNEFRSLRWMPLQPEHLDYPNSQILLIGEGQDDLGKATEQQAGDEKAEKDTPLEEMEKLEDEDERRVEGLKGDDSVFEDLDLSKKEYATIPTTW